MSSWWTERFRKQKFNQETWNPDALQDQLAVEAARSRIDLYRKMYLEVINDLGDKADLDNFPTLVSQKLIKEIEAMKDPLMNIAVRSASLRLPKEVLNSKQLEISTVGKPMLRQHSVLLETDIGQRLNYLSVPDQPHANNFLCLLDEDNNTTQTVRRYILKQREDNQFAALDVFSDPSYPAIMSAGSNLWFNGEWAEPSLLARLTAHLTEKADELIGMLPWTQKDKAQYVLKYGSLG